MAIAATTATTTTTTRAAGAGTSSILLNYVVENIKKNPQNIFDVFVVKSTTATATTIFL